jgi:Tfp pilus assembly PilM family ATPase
VSAPSPKLRLARLEPPLRRVLAIDAGSRVLRFALVERSWRRLRILREQSLDLAAEGLVSAGEISTHLHTLLEECGRPPVALALPQHLSTSQLIDLPPVPDSEVRRLIEEETRRLGGVSDSAIIFDYAPVAPLAPNRQYYWVSLCQEGEIREQLARLDLEQAELCEVTTTATALITAFQATIPQARRAVLVHGGAQSTVVVILLDGRGVFAASFPVGGDFFTRAIASQLRCAVETAENLRQRKNLLAGDDALPGFPAVVDGWLAELLRQLQDWSREHAAVAPDLKSFELFISGGVFSQPGLVSYLEGRSGLTFKTWLSAAQAGAVAPGSGYEVAFGTALQALGRSPQPASLLPPDRRLAWRRRLTRQLVECASVVLLALLLVVLLYGTWQQSSLGQRKRQLLEQVEQALREAEENAGLTDNLMVDYEELRPLLERQQQTLGTLQTLALLEQARSNRPYWYVLLADQQTYFTQPLPVVGTNAPGATNGPVAPRRLPPWVTGSAGTNAPVTRPGFIAELCIPEPAEAARRTFGDLVGALKQDPLFSRADSLSPDLRRELADPKVLLPERHFSLALDLADAQWPRANGPRPRGPLPATNGPVRPGGRFPRPAGDAFGPPPHRPVACPSSASTNVSEGCSSRPQASLWRRISSWASYLSRGAPRASTRR